MSIYYERQSFTYLLSNNLLTYFLSRWKHAKIMKIRKPQKWANDPKSCRPIILLLIFVMVFERLMLPKLLTNILLPNQISSLDYDRSAHSNCNFLKHSRTRSMPRGVSRHRENFRPSWHPGLLYKVKPLPSDTHYRLVQSFVSNRTFHDSIPLNLWGNEPGPQGSVCGAILYLLYVSGIPAGMIQPSYPRTHLEQ